MADSVGPSGLVVVFMCNHCPYVVAVIDRIVRDFAELTRQGFGVVAINANDSKQYPEDSFDNMIAFAARHGIDFPYLHDAGQTVARAYGAVCTPDFFGFDSALALRYRGRLDSSGRQPAAPDARRELFEAMIALKTGGAAPAEQWPAIGCSIKWRDD
jgi:peroxiredoxin